MEVACQNEIPDERLGHDHAQRECLLFGEPIGRFGSDAAIDVDAGNCHYRPSAAVRLFLFGTLFNGRFKI